MKIYLLIFSIFLFSCTENDEVVLKTTVTPITINFTHNWDGVNITANEFNNLIYTNANGETLSLSKLKYLISKMQLHKTDGTTLNLKNYILVDVKNDDNLNFTTSVNIPKGNYTNLSFVFGFDETDNAQNYISLNSVSWNWPDIIGGGYHFMQMEGKYIIDGGVVEETYAYHMGTARVSIGVFEANHFNVNLGSITVNQNQEINIEMNIAEWYKNTYTWDLTQYNNTLMQNYDAQKYMNENGTTVFNLRN